MMKTMKDFSLRADRVLEFAKEEAQRFHHNYVGTEHLLLGLIRVGEGIALNVLQKMGLNLETVRLGVEKELDPGATFSVTHPSFTVRLRAEKQDDIHYTPRAKNVFAHAAEVAQALSHSCIDTEHILLALLRERESNSVATRVLENLNVDFDQARTEIINEMDPCFERTSGAEGNQSTTGKNEYVKFSCFSCGQHIEIDVQACGMIVDCPTCNTLLTVPSAASRFPRPKVVGKSWQRKACARESALRWYQATRRREAACDKCNALLSAGEGYLCKPAIGIVSFGPKQVAFSQTPDLLCEKCFDGSPAAEPFEGDVQDIAVQPDQSSREQPPWPPRVKRLIIFWSPIDFNLRSPVKWGFWDSSPVFVDPLAEFAELLAEAGLDLNRVTKETIAEIDRKFLYFGQLIRCQQVDIRGIQAGARDLTKMTKEECRDYFRLEESEDFRWHTHALRFATARLLVIIAT